MAMGWTSEQLSQISILDKLQWIMYVTDTSLEQKVVKKS